MTSLYLTECIDSVLKKHDPYNLTHAFAVTTPFQNWAEKIRDSNINYQKSPVSLSFEGSSTVIISISSKLVYIYKKKML